MRPNWFVGLPVAPGTWFDRVSDPPPGARRFHPEDLHLTVAFLGAVRPEAAARAFACAARLPLASCEATLGEVVPMGNRARFSALSARLAAGEAEIATAIGAVRDAACDAAGAPRDARPVLPHLTVGRVGRGAGPEERRTALRWAGALALGGVSVAITRVALYTWSPERGARLFQIVASAALDDPVRMQR